MRSDAIPENELLERFLRYVQVDTQADEQAECYPSSSGQWELGRLLVDELRAVGLEQVEQDEHGLVTATIPPTPAHESAPVAVLNAHLDTSPESPGGGVRPQVVRPYEGGDIVLPGDRSQVIRVSENPELPSLHGRTLITTDGTTLLGADDKAGIAVIVTAAEFLARRPEIAHGPVRLLFTCDEEIGRGVDHVDLERLGAHVGYTLDGAGADCIDVETFSADMATVTVEGRNIHPSIAFGRMINAVRAAGAYLSRLPRETLSPETTRGRDGFLHPYQIDGGVAGVTLRVLLRDFETARLASHADVLRKAADDVMREFEGIRITVDVRPQYRNLGDGLRREPRVVELAEEAMRRLGRDPHRTIVRGGTDGALLTARGLPTPNLSTGQHNPHSPLEWACLEEMQLAAAVVVQLLELWAKASR